MAKQKNKVKQGSQKPAHYENPECSADKKKAIDDMVERAKQHIKERIASMNIKNNGSAAAPATISERAECSLNDSNGQLRPAGNEHHNRNASTLNSKNISGALNTSRPLHSEFTSQTFMQLNNQTRQYYGHHQPDQFGNNYSQNNVPHFNGPPGSFNTSGMHAGYNNSNQHNSGYNHNMNAAPSMMDEWRARDLPHTAAQPPTVVTAVTHPLLPSTQKPVLIAVPTATSCAAPTQKQETTNTKSEAELLEQVLMHTKDALYAIEPPKGHISVTVENIHKDVDLSIFHNVMQSFGRLPQFLPEKKLLASDPSCVTAIYSRIEGASRAVRVLSKLIIRSHTIVARFSTATNCQKKLTKFEKVKEKELKSTVSKLLFQYDIRWVDEATTTSTKAVVTPAANSKSAASINSYVAVERKLQNGNNLKRNNSEDPISDKNSEQYSQTHATEAQSSTRPHEADKLGQSHQSEKSSPIPVQRKRSRSPNLMMIESIDNEQKNVNGLQDNKQSTKNIVEESNHHGNKKLKPNSWRTMLESSYCDEDDNDRKETEDVDSNAKKINNENQLFRDGFNIKLSGGMMDLSKSAVNNINFVFGGTEAPVFHQGWWQLKIGNNRQAKLLQKVLDKRRIIDDVLEVHWKGNKHVPGGLPAKITQSEMEAYRVQAKRALELHNAALRPIILGKLNQALNKPQDQLKSCSSTICKNPVCLAYYHSDRSSQQHPYSSTRCPNLEKGRRCPRGDACEHSHTDAEACAHLGPFQSSIDAGPFCCQPHPDTPDMFYHREWKDLFVSGLHNSYLFIAGAIRNTHKLKDLSGVQVLAVTADTTICHHITSLMTDTARRHAVRMAEIITGFEDPSGSHIVVGTVMGLLKLLRENGAGPLNRLGAIIIDDVPAMFSKRSEKSALVRLIRMIYEVHHDTGRLNKVLIAPHILSRDVHFAEVILATTFNVIDKIKEPPTDEMNSNLLISSKSRTNFNDSFRDVIVMKDSCSRDYNEIEEIIPPNDRRSEMSTGERSSPNDRRSERRIAVVRAISNDRRSVKRSAEEMATPNDRRSEQRSADDRPLINDRRSEKIVANEMASRIHQQPKRSGEKRPIFNNKSFGEGGDTKNVRTSNETSVSIKETEIADVYIRNPSATGRGSRRHSSTEARAWEPSTKSHPQQETLKRDHMDESDPVNQKIGVHLTAKQFLAEERTLRQELDEEYSVYIEVPEMHPNYEGVYERFLARFQLSGGGKNLSEEEEWISYWRSELETSKKTSWMEIRKNLVEKYKTVLAPKKANIESNASRNSSQDMMGTNMNSSLLILESLCDHMGLLGSALQSLICESRYYLNPLRTFVDSDNIALLKMCLKKLKTEHETSSPPLSGKLNDGIMHGEKLLKYADEELKRIKNEKCERNIKHFGLDLKKIAEATVGRDPLFIMNFIKCTLDMQGDKNLPKSDLDNICLDVSSIHFEMSISEPSNLPDKKSCERLHKTIEHTKPSLTTRDGLHSPHPAASERVFPNGSSSSVENSYTLAKYASLPSAERASSNSNGDWSSTFPHQLVVPNLPQPMHISSKFGVSENNAVKRPVQQNDHHLASDFSNLGTFHPETVHLQHTLQNLEQVSAASHSVVSTANLESSRISDSWFVKTVKSIVGHRNLTIDLFNQCLSQILLDKPQEYKFSKSDLLIVKELQALGGLDLSEELFISTLKGKFAVL